MYEKRKSDDNKIKFQHSFTLKHLHSHLQNIINDNYIKNIRYDAKIHFNELMNKFSIKTHIQH